MAPTASQTTMRRRRAESQRASTTKSTAASRTAMVMMSKARTAVLHGGQAVRLHERDGADVVGQVAPQERLQLGHAIGVGLVGREVRDLHGRPG